MTRMNTTETTVTVDDATTEPQPEAEVQEVTQETAEPELDEPNAGAITALRKERADRKAAEKELRELRQQLEDRDKPADQKALDDVRREATAEATGKANKRLVAAEFRSAAAARVKDPRIAAALVDLADIEVDDDGNVDAAGITAALDDLLTEYPDLAPSRFEGTADQGTKGKTALPAQVTAKELETMSAAEVNTARREGRLKTLLGK